MISKRFRDSFLRLSPLTNDPHTQASSSLTVRMAVAHPGVTWTPYCIR